MRCRAWDVGQVVYMTRGMQERRDEEIEGYRKEGMQNWRDAGQEGCKKGEMLDRWNHRIIIDRTENGIKGSRIWHCAFAASIFKVQRLRQY